MGMVSLTRQDPIVDYADLIDAETWAFINATKSFDAGGAPGPSVADQRRSYGEMCRAFYRGRPAGVDSQDLKAGEIPVRVYSAGKPSRTVVYLHGGGHVLGNLDSHDDFCAEICAETGYRVVSVDYRLAPEHRHPAAFDDAWSATQWARAHFDNAVVLAGDSAGGNLAAAVAHYARGRLDGIIGQVLIYPVLGNGVEGGSHVEHANAPLLSASDCLYYHAQRIGSAGAPLNDPTFLPLQDSDFSGLPPTVVVTADCDPLRDDGRAYSDSLAAAGVPVCWINEFGLVHGYLRARTSVARAGDSVERIIVAIEALGQGLWPYD